MTNSIIALQRPTKNRTVFKYEVDFQLYTAGGKEHFQNKVL